MSQTLSSISPGLQLFRLGFEVSPIILTGGVASFIPGGMLPIVAITQAVSFLNGLLTGGDITSVDDFFARFKVAPGATLIDNDYGQYPFANQSVAANAVIANPLAVSLFMYCPARGSGGVLSKLATMEALAATLNLHSQNGGLYTVVTPTQIYTACVLAKLADITPSDSNQPQSIWQWDFTQPLVTENEAATAQSGLISALTGGTFTTGALSGLTQAVSGAAGAIGGAAGTVASSVLSAAQNLIGVI